MSQGKSPFYVVEDFLSPKQADYIVDSLNFVEPDTDREDMPVMSARSSHHCESIVFNQLENIRADVEQYFDFEWKGTETMSFEFYPEECVTGHDPQCGNSEYGGKKWFRVNGRDFTGILFLSDYNDARSDAFDPTFEVYGGKLNFPQWGFGFNPKRGTLVIFPAYPNFINVVGPVHAGDLLQVRFHIRAEKLWPWEPKKFPGNYKTWW